MSIQFKRGTQTKVDATTSTLLAGQPLLATDTGELTIGTANNQSPSLGKKYVPIELSKEKECDLTLTSRSDTWTKPISDISSSTSGFVWEATLHSINYTNIGHNPPPSWTGLTSAGSYVNYIVVKIPAGTSTQPFGGGDNYLKVKFLVSGSNYAVTYFKFSTLSTSIPTTDCYLILSAPNDLAINTSNTSTARVLNVLFTAVQEAGDSTYISRDAGYTYYGGEKLVAKSSISVSDSIKVTGNYGTTTISNTSLTLSTQGGTTTLTSTNKGLSIGRNSKYVDIPYSKSGTVALTSDVPEKTYSRHLYISYSTSTTSISLYTVLQTPSVVSIATVADLINVFKSMNITSITWPCSGFANINGTVSSVYALSYKDSSLSILYCTNTDTSKLTLESSRGVTNKLNI